MMWLLWVMGWIVLAISVGMVSDYGNQIGAMGHRARSRGNRIHCDTEIDRCFPCGSCRTETRHN